MATKQFQNAKLNVTHLDLKDDASRSVLQSGENISHSLGKIARWYKDIIWTDSKATTEVFGIVKLSDDYKSESTETVPTSKTLNDVVKLIKQTGGWNTTYDFNSNIEGDENLQNGQFKVTEHDLEGDIDHYVSIKGLGSAAYTNKSDYATADHTHKYAGSDSVGGAAISANKLNTDAGSDVNPIYFSNGIPVACTYSLNKTVPSNALFTDAKVKQTATTTDADYEILFSSTADNTTRTAGARKNSNLTFNPSTGTLTTTKFIGELSGNATTATTANKLSNTTAIGSSIKPVYFSADGIPVAIDHSIETSVPSNAVFTDTTYTISSGDNNGQIKVTPSEGDPYNVSVKGLGSAAYTNSDEYATAGHTHKYAGSASVGGPATSANKINTDAGSTANPVYFKNGIPVACTHSLNSTVPSDAVFTDTTYTIESGDSNGQIKITPSVGDPYNVSVKGLGSAAYTDSSDYATAGHTHNYAGSSTAGGVANSAAKLSDVPAGGIGSETKPVFFSGTTGRPVACTYSLNATVPANAIFTDEKVKQSPVTTDGSFEVLFAGSTGNTAKTEGVGKTTTLTFNPSTGALSATSFTGNGSSLTTLNASNISSGTLSVNRLPGSAVTIGTYGPAAGGTLSHSGTFDVPDFTVDAKGRITGAHTRTFTLPAQYTHPTHTSKASGLYKITVDSLGHVSETAAVTKSDIPALDYVSSTTTRNPNVVLAGPASGTTAAAPTFRALVVADLPSSGATAGSYGPSANATPGYGSTFNVPYITVDAKGRVTAISTKTVKIPASDNTDTKVTQTATTTSAAYEVLFSGTADNTTRTEGARKSNNLLFNPSTGVLQISGTEYGAIEIYRKGSAYGAAIEFYNDATNNTKTKLGSICMKDVDGDIIRYLANDSTTHKICDTKNTSFTRSLSSGTKIGTITIAGTSTDLYCQTNTNTTYSFATGDTNGTFKVTPSGGTATNIAIKGLGSAAYTASSAYAAASHTHNYAGSSTAGGPATLIAMARVKQDSKVFPGQNRVKFEEYTAGDSYNLPTNAWYHIISMQGADTRYGTQIAIGMTANKRMYFRNYNESSWQAWNEVSIVGHTHSYLSTTTKYALSSSVGGPAYSVEGSEGTDASFRHVWFSTSNTETRRAYSDKFMFEPASGILKFNSWYPLDITDNTVDLNSYNDGSGKYGYRRYICRSTGGGNKISNKPCDSPFLLEVFLIRFATASSDYITKQVYHAFNKKTYQRFCTNGTWDSWTELKYTDTNTDTKNTAGSTNTSSKIFLIGATSQAANPQTYSHDTAYVGTDGCLYSNSKKVSVEGHTHSYLPLAGGTMTGDITFAGVSSTTYPALSNQIYFSGSTDWARILYEVTASDAGQLVFETGDDANTKIVFRNKVTSGGTYTRQVTIADGVISGNGSGLTSLNASNISSGTLSADRLATSGVKAGSYGPSANATPGYGSTFNVPYITVDAKGRVTAISTKTVKITASDNTDTKVTQTATTTSATYEVLFSGTADNTTRTEGARKNSNLTFNPSTGVLTATKFDGQIVGKKYDDYDPFSTEHDYHPVLFYQDSFGSPSKVGYSNLGFKYDSIHDELFSGGMSCGVLNAKIIDMSGTTDDPNSEINYKGTKATHTMIKFIDNAGDTTGNGIVIGGGGLVVVGAGESANNLVSAASLPGGQEKLYLTSDSEIYFYINCNTIGDRKGMTLNTSLHLYPNSNNTGSVGTSSNKWNAMYATTFYGAFSGSGASVTSLNASNISSGTLSADRLATSGVKAGSYGPSANASPAHSGTFNVPYITVDNKGRVMAIATRTITLPASGNTDANVKQSATSTANFRGVILGTNNTVNTGDTRETTVTGQGYITNKIFAQPSTGNLYASNIYAFVNGTDEVRIALYRSGNSSWRFVNNGGTLSLQNNYYSDKVQSWYNVAQFDYGGINSMKFTTPPQLTGTNRSTTYGYSTIDMAICSKNSWAMSMRWLNNARNAVRGSFGAYGTADNLTYYYWGNEYNATKLRLYPGTGGGLVSQQSNGFRIATNGYGVIFRVDSDNFYILLTDKKTDGSELTGDNWNSKRPLQIGLSSGVCNINGNAYSANFLQNAMFYSESSDASSKRYYRVAYAKTNGTYVDMNAVFLITNEWGQEMGIIKVRARTEGTAGVFGGSKFIEWVCNSGFDPAIVKLVVKNNYDVNTAKTGTATAEVWLDNNARYKGIKFTILSQGFRTGSSKMWTMSSNSSGGNTAMPTTGVTSTITGTNKSISNNAATSSKIYSTNTPGSSSHTGYSIPFFSGPIDSSSPEKNDTAASGNKTILHNGEFRLGLLEGTTSTDGYAQLVLGNGIASGTAGNKYGKISLYSSSAYAVQIIPANVTGTRTITLPNASGTVALTSHTHSYIPTSSAKTLFSGTAAASITMTSMSGYTRLVVFCKNTSNSSYFTVELQCTTGYHYHAMTVSPPPAAQTSNSFYGLLFNLSSETKLSVSAGKYSNLSSSASLANGPTVHITKVIGYKF